MPTAQEDAAMSDSSYSHKRHLDYTYRLPTPPRIIVPPPTLTSEVPELHFSSAPSPDDDLDTSFLKEMNLDSIVQKNTLLEWSYERRRQAQMVLPWLWLGPLTAAKDVAFLKRERITMVIAIRSTEASMNGVLQIARGVCQEVSAVEAPNYFALTGKLSETTRRINQHIAKFRKHTTATGNPQLGKVLVFCESGNEKSAAVAAAYLMETLDDFNYIKSMQVCQAQRFCVNFDDSVKNILRIHWDIMLARRAVADSRSALLQSTALSNGLRQVAPHLEISQSDVTKPKRSIEDTRDDDDVTMTEDGEPSDVLRFTDRDITPFKDT